MIENYLAHFTALTLTQKLILGSFCAFLLIRTLYLLLFTARVAFKSKKQDFQYSNEPISLILTIRNEEKSIRENLPSILGIEDVPFEVIAVDDFSQDSTLSRLGLLAQRYEHMKISSLSQETRFSVKLAQNIALKSASNNWVLIVPITFSGAKSQWLYRFSEMLEKNDKNLIVGYSTVSPQRGIFNLLYRMETFLQQIKSVGYISNGISFIYSEDNVAFRKEKYFQLGGYGKYLREPHANFELIVNAFIKRKRTIINFYKSAVIRKNVEIYKADFCDLLKKSFRIEKQLPFWKKQVLKADEISKLLFPVLVALSLTFVFDYWSFVVSLIGIYLLIYAFVFKRTMNKLGERKIFLFLLLYNLLMPYYKFIYRGYFNSKFKA